METNNLNRTQRARRYRNVMTTRWNAHRMKMHKDVAYYICQREKCPDTGKLHWHDYIEFKRQLTLSQIQEIIGDPTAHIECRRGSQQQAITYCSKADTRVEGPYEEGTKKEQGQRIDLDEIYELIQDGLTESEIMDSHFPTWVRYRKSLQEAIALVRERDLRLVLPKIKVIVLRGDPGVGKTTKALQLTGEDVYLVMHGDGTWWDGYRGQKSILIDDYEGEFPYRHLLRILDRYKMRIQTKGGTVFNGWDTVVITSNVTPQEWYPGRDIRALNRRITEAITMLHCPKEHKDCENTREITEWFKDI